MVVKLPLHDRHARAAKDNIEVHTIDTDGRIVPESRKII